jgi:hypothetical protein
MEKEALHNVFFLIHYLCPAIFHTIMEEPPLSVLFATTVLLGVSAHLFLFKRVEVDSQPLIIAGLFLGAPFFVSYILSHYSAQYAKHSLKTAFSLLGCFTSSLGSSILLYRAFFHRLGKFPGPFLAKLSKFWALRQTIRTGMKWYQVDVELHKQYGDYVRTGIDHWNQLMSELDNI